MPEIDRRLFLATCAAALAAPSLPTERDHWWQDWEVESYTVVQSEYPTNFVWFANRMVWQDGAQTIRFSEPISIPSQDIVERVALSA